MCKAETWLSVVLCTLSVPCKLVTIGGISKKARNQVYAVKSLRSHILGGFVGCGGQYVRRGGGSRTYLRSQVPHDKVIFCAVSHKLVAQLLEPLPYSPSIGFDLQSQL